MVFIMVFQSIIILDNAYGYLEMIDWEDRTRGTPFWIIDLDPNWNQLSSFVSFIILLWPLFFLTLQCWSALLVSNIMKSSGDWSPRKIFTFTMIFSCLGTGIFPEDISQIHVCFFSGGMFPLSTFWLRGSSWVNFLSSKTNFHLEIFLLSSFFGLYDQERASTAV